jgi:Fe-S-cluster-containing dehydrogenase component
MCYDRTTTGRKPMCATVCPSGALFYGTRQEIETLRQSAVPINRFQFGGQVIHTKVNMMAPRTRTPEYLDVAAAMQDAPVGQDLLLNILTES